MAHTLNTRGELVTFGTPEFEKDYAKELKAHDALFNEVESDIVDGVRPIDCIGAPYDVEGKQKCKRLVFKGDDIVKRQLGVLLGAQLAEASQKHAAAAYAATIGENDTNIKSLTAALKG